MPSVVMESRRRCASAPMLTAAPGKAAVGAATEWLRWKRFVKVAWVTEPRRLRDISFWLVGLSEDMASDARERETLRWE
jgi:hypothetical protein